MSHRPRFAAQLEVEAAASISDHRKAFACIHSIHNAAIAQHVHSAFMTCSKWCGHNNLTWYQATKVQGGAQSDANCAAGCGFTGSNPAAYAEPANSSNPQAALDLYQPVSGAGPAGAVPVTAPVDPASAALLHTQGAGDADRRPLCGTHCIRYLHPLLLLQRVVHHAVGCVLKKNGCQPTLFTEVWESGLARPPVALKGVLRRGEPHPHQHCCSYKTLPVPIWS